LVDGRFVLGAHHSNDLATGTTQHRRHTTVSKAGPAAATDNERSGNSPERTERDGQNGTTTGEISGTSTANGPSVPNVGSVALVFVAR
jgi:hypothetical protein